jgi:NAD(P)-dependent dehydrogenase (short-subunit alcohol dehydrogenase family)
MGFPLLTYYNASKYAVEAITDSLRYEVAPFGIRVHSVLPGLFGTRFVSKGLVANPATVSPASPYAALAAKLIPVVAKKINEGPDPVAVAEAVLRIIEDAGSPIRTSVGVEAETFVPMVKQLTDEAFEAKVTEIFGL